MKLKQRRLIVFIIWILIILAGPITVFKNTPLTDAFSSYFLFANVFQRMTALLAFSLFFVQLILGAYMDKWKKVLGTKVFRIHTKQGLFAYVFVLIHLLFKMYFDFFQAGAKGIFAIFLPESVYLNFGKIAFLLLSLVVVAGYLRAKPPLRRNWKKFHAINYLAFFFIIIHSLSLGTDMKTPPFSLVYKISIILVIAIAMTKGYCLLTRKSDKR